jgi:hypothetical protein
MTGLSSSSSKRRRSPRRCSAACACAFPEASRSVSASAHNLSQVGMLATADTLLVLSLPVAPGEPEVRSMGFPGSPGPGPTLQGPGGCPAPTGGPGPVRSLVATRPRSSATRQLARLSASSECQCPGDEVRSGQVRLITRPKSRTMRAKRKQRSRANITKVPK